MSDEVISLANSKQVLSLSAASNMIDDYPPLTLRLYDRLDNDAVHDEVTPDDIGRLIIIEPLQQATAWGLLEARLPWHLVPAASRLEYADPEGELYANATEPFAAVDAVPGVGSAIASKLLHLKRPDFFPILDSRLERLYKESAAAAYQRSRVWQERRPEWRHLYWAAIREDLTSEPNIAFLQQLRVLLITRSHDSTAIVERRRRAAALGNLRLLDIFAWAVTP